MIVYLLDIYSEEQSVNHFKMFGRILKELLSPIVIHY